MQIPLFSDIKNDKSFKGNFLKVFVFILLIIVIDFLISIFLQKGVERYYGLGDDSEVVLLGNSQLMLAVDKVLLEKRIGIRTAKYTREGVNIADLKIMAEHYLSACKTMPKAVVLGLDPWLFTGKGLSQNSWQLFLPFMDDPYVKEYVKSSIPRKSDYLRYKFIKSSRYNALLLNASIRGRLNNWSNLKYGVIDTVRFNNEQILKSFRRIINNRELQDNFSSALDLLAGEDLSVILLITPVWQPILNTQKPEYDRTMYLIDSLVQKHCPSALIVNLTSKFTDRTGLFFDPIHMNPEGQRVVTEYFSKVLDSLRLGKHDKNF